MSEQLELVPAPARLTDRQQTALDAITAAGATGLTASEIGDHLGGHPAYTRSNGMSVAKALKKRGLIVQRRNMIFVAANTKTEPETAEEWDGTGPVPYGVIPY